MRKHTDKNQPGLSMIEVLIVVTIISLLLITAFFTYQSQLAKARDGQRKADLEKLRVAFEDYYNDNDCYPPADIFGSPKDPALCGTGVLAPYIKQLPCDPATKQPYDYVPLAACAGYRLLAKLEIESDESITKVGCSVSAGCGTSSPFAENNYGVSAGTAVPE